jgi:hypothetical protein
MKFIGLVQWTKRDKNDNPIAGVRPLIELQKNDWRTIDSLEEFPTQGQAFWFNAQGASENALILFRAEPNPGQKDQFKVVDPKLVLEVLDLQKYGTPSEVRAALAEGIHLPGAFTSLKALILCKPDLLVGPVELNRVNGRVRLVAKNLHRLPAYAGPEIYRVAFDHTEKLLRIDDTPPSGFVDWDDEAAILRRAIDAAVKMAKQSGHDLGPTKKQIEEMTRAITAQSVGPDAQLDQYRFRRALELLEVAEVAEREAAEFVEVFREHPSIKAALVELQKNVREKVEVSARADLEKRFEKERVKLEEAIQLNDQKKKELNKLEEQLTEMQGRVAEAEKEAENAVNACVLSAVERPLELLAQVSVLKPFIGFGGSQTATTPTPHSSTRLDWSSARGGDIRDKAALRRNLTNAARARGVDPSLMFQVHAAIVAQLMPVTLGSGALGALTAYAHGACGGRLAIVHVSPSAINPNDLDEVAGGGLKVAVEAAKDIDGISLVVLEGANRSPLESSVLPVLQLAELHLSPLKMTPGLRLAASLVVGATTVPVTSQLWSHACAIYAEPIPPTVSNNATGDVSLTCELFIPGDEPAGSIESLLDTWPECRELRPAMIRLGSALARLYDDESRVTEALLNNLVLPYIATAFTADEQAELLSKTRTASDSTVTTLHRLRRRLA